MNRTQLLAVIIATCVSSAATLMTTRLLEPQHRLATLDPGVLVTEHLQSLDPKLDKAALEAKGRAFAKRLDTAVTQIAHQYGVILLVRPAVIIGAPDYTDEVRRRINAH